MKRVDLIDTYRHKGLRQQLINELKSKGIHDDRVLAAMNRIPRHFFLDLAFDKIAYEDRAFQIGAGQTISQPFTVAFQTQLLQINKLDKVLEVGTGSVYQASVLAELGAQVFTIERQKSLFDTNKLYYPLASTYKNIKFFYGDGFKGLPKYAPFDKIIITAAAPHIPDELLSQLKIGGCMVLPLATNRDDVQQMTKIIKQNDGSFTTESFGDFSFVPMLVGRNS